MNPFRTLPSADRSAQKTGTTSFSFQVTRLRSLLILLGSSLLLTGCLSSGSSGSDTTQPAGPEAPANINVLTAFAGTYTVSGTATEHTADRGTATRNHARGTITIHSNGTVDYDTGISFAAAQINAIYDRRNICDFPPEANRAACRVHVNYDADDTGRKLEIFLDLDKTSVKEIRYQNGQGEITRALIGSGTGNGGGEITTEPNGTRDQSTNGYLLDLAGLAFPEGLQTGLHYGFIVQDAQRVGDRVLVFAQRDYSVLSTGHKERMIFRLAADGRNLDSTFADGGLLKVADSETRSVSGAARSHALDNSGRILLLNGHGESIYSLQRYTSNGVLDATFASSGQLKGRDHHDPINNPNPTPWGSSSSRPTALAILNDNSIIWGGSQGEQFSGFKWSLGRVTAAGAITGTTQAITPPSTSNQTTISQLLLDEEGSHLYVLGIGGQNQYLVARLGLDDLALDENFGSNGFVTLDATTSRINDLLLDEQGRLVLVGTGTGGSSVNSSSAGQGYHVYRLTRSGVLDTTFGTTGLVKVDFGRSTGTTYHDVATQVQVSPSGKLLVSGYTRSNNNIDNQSPWLTMARIDAQGNLDAGFGFTTNRLSIGLQGRRISIRSSDGDHSDNATQIAVAIDKDGRLMGFSTQRQSTSESRAHTGHPVMIQWWD